MKSAQTTQIISKVYSSEFLVVNLASFYVHSTREDL